MAFCIVVTIYLTPILIFKRYNADFIRL